ncbi:MAG: UbiA family prenyltransferase, partial [Bacteroidales bacterium]|nr:UbiA family prenyltransferase [Bacteroidales bacterium]
MIKETKKKVKRYLSLVKFSHTIFAMPFALIGYFLALHQTESEFEWRLFLFVTLCMVFARNAAMAFNRFIDREIDIKNPRTAIREIPAGIIKAKSALLFVIVNSILFFVTTYFINTLTFRLSPVALLIILGYSLTKKFTALC